MKRSQFPLVFVFWFMAAGAAMFMPVFLGSHQAYAGLVRYEYSGQLDSSHLSGSLSRSVAFSGWFIYDPDEVLAILDGRNPPDTVMNTTSARLTLRGENELGEMTSFTVSDDSATLGQARKSCSLVMYDAENKPVAHFSILGGSLPLLGVTSDERVFDRAQVALLYAAERRYSRVCSASMR